MRAVLFWACFKSLRGPLSYCQKNAAVHNETPSFAPPHSTAIKAMKTYGDYEVWTVAGRPKLDNVNSYSDASYSSSVSVGSYSAGSATWVQFNHPRGVAVSAGGPSPVLHPRCAGRLESWRSWHRTVDDITSRSCQLESARAISSLWRTEIWSEPCTSSIALMVTASPA